MSVWLNQDHHEFLVELELLCFLTPEPPELDMLDAGDSGSGFAALCEDLRRDLGLADNAQFAPLLRELRELHGVHVTGMNVRHRADQGALRTDQRARRALRVSRETWPRARGLCEWYWRTVIECDDRESAHESDAA